MLNLTYCDSFVKCDGIFETGTGRPGGKNCFTNISYCKKIISKVPFGKKPRKCGWTCKQTMGSD